MQETKNELTEKQQQNRKEDKKAFKKFAWILVLAFVVGIMVGSASSALKNLLENTSVLDILFGMVRNVAIYGGYVITTLLLCVSLVLYGKSRMEYTTWDEEDEDVLCGIETKLSYINWFSNLILYGSYFFFSTGIWAVDILDVKGAVKQDGVTFFVGMGAVFIHMVYAMTAACIIQQKAVNLSKEINPEKSGSIYDIKFQDKWLENCDEAERYTTYKCSYKTFKTMQTVGMVLWLICLIGQFIFHTGVFATVIVTIFLIIQTSVYCVQGIYFAKHPSEVMK